MLNIQHIFRVLEFSWSLLGLEIKKNSLENASYWDMDTEPSTYNEKAQKQHPLFPISQQEVSKYNKSR